MSAFRLRWPVRNFAMARRQARSRCAGAYPCGVGWAWTTSTDPRLCLSSRRESTHLFRGAPWVQSYIPAGAQGRAKAFDERAMRLRFIELLPQSKVVRLGARDETGVTVLDKQAFLIYSSHIHVIRLY
jgi:hypothetical protein